MRSSDGFGEGTPREGTTGSGYTSGSTGGANLGGTGGTADDFDRYDTGWYRRHFTTRSSLGASPATATPGTYEEARTGYELGHRAASTPTYSGRPFEEVVVELESDWGQDKPTKFEQVRDFARHAFEWKTVLGGLALALGGWWAGSKLWDAVGEMNEEDEQDCVVFFEAHPARSTGLTYEQARTGYALGYLASRNPDYTGRGFDDVETHLRGGFTGSYGASYDSVRDFTRRGYERGTLRGTGGSMGGTTGGLGSTGSTGTGGTMGGTTGGLGSAGTGGTSGGLGSTGTGGTSGGLGSTGTGGTSGGLGGTQY